MAQFYTDFSDQEPGGAPSGWTERWVTGGHAIVVVEAADATGGRVLRHVIAENNRRAFSWDAVPGASDVEIVARVRSNDADARFGVIARGAGEGPVRDNEDGFTTELEPGRHTSEQRPEERADEPQFVTRSYDHRQTKSPARPHGTGKQDGVTPFPWQPGEFTWLRLRLRGGADGVDVFARAWTGGVDDEPTEWIHEQPGSEPTEIGANGWVGITGQGTAGDREYDLIGVGTDGDPAPTAPV